VNKNVNNQSFFPLQTDRKSFGASARDVAVFCANRRLEIA